VLTNSFTDSLTTSLTHNDRANRQNDTGWTKVVHKKAIEKNNDDKRLRAAPVKRRLQLHLTRLHTDTTTGLIQEYIANKNLVPLDCEELKIRYNTYKSFKVVLDVTDNFPWNDIYDENFWPEGIMIRKFYNDLKSARTNKPDHGTRH